MALWAASLGLAAEQPTFRTSVDLVTVDAAVHDAAGRPVPDLRAEDFRLEVDGRVRPVTSAQFVSEAAGAASPDGVAGLPASPIHFSSNEGTDAGRVIVIAVDEAHIRRLEGRRAMVSAVRFIESLPEADRVGVVGLSAGDTVTLTRDRATLRRHLESMVGIGDPVAQQLNIGISEALEIAEGSRTRLADAVLRECGRALTEYVNLARAADDAGGGRDACPEQVEQESRAMAQFAHMQARLSLTAIESLITRLKDLPGPKTIVLISEGMIVDPRRVDLSALAALAQAARVTIYGLQVEVPEVDASTARVSPTLLRDMNVRRDGVAQVAGAARGAVFRQVGTDPKPFERIARELSGYYLLAFEARDSDRDGKPHRIRVTVDRRGVALRARSGFTMPPLSAADRGAQLSRLLTNMTTVSELPLRVATYAYAEPAAKGVRVVISGEAGAGSAPAGIWMGFVLVNEAGVIAATATQQAADGRHAFSAAVPAGTYTLRAAAIDPLGRQGSVERVFRVQPPTPDAMHVGDLLLAPVPPAPDAPLSPIVDRISGEAIVAYLELHAAAAGPRPDEVRFSVARDAGEPPVVAATAAVTVREGVWGIARATLPIASLASGRYEARAEILAAGAVAGRVIRPFTITSR
ncbi:MAG TPA: VWA domain-containing protein [Vicinamibacterales bacterium]|nr:VWA domain-containing protein [Vicinamibacterales bacterium]